MGDLQRASVQRSAAQPAARVRELPARARQAEREPIARPLRRMLALRALQPQLAVGAVDDPFEREAERTADAVTSTDPPRPGAFGARPLAASLLRVAQRALGKGETPAKKDEDEKTRKLQKKPAAGTGPEIVPRGVESQIQAMSAGGDPLTPALRSVFEPRFGYDFSSVRTHSGSDAAGAAVALGARAFTVGDHIYFAAGEYQPASPSGQRLIAHELTHTIQQKPVAARVQRSLFGDARAAVLERIRRWARELPPYELLTVLLGRDPITQQAVERSGVNILHAALRLVPNGQQIFEDMRQSGSLERAAAWFDAEIARLNLTWQGIRALFTQAWDAISPLDFLRPSAVWERIRGIFGPPFERLRNFAAAVGRRILDFIKERVLQQLRTWAQRIPGYRLLTFILRQDPFTDEPVPRTPVTFVRAVLDLVPGGERIFQNLERTRTIERTMEWLRGEIARLDLTWNAIKGLFLRAWNAFSVTDLLRPLALIERIAGIFAEPARRVARFALAVGRKVLEFIFEGAMALAGPLGQQVLRFIRRAGAILGQIFADPVRFLHNLIDALRLGFTQFRRNIVDHMRTALVQWLVGALEGAGIQLPQRWDLRGILSLVLQVLGISRQRIRLKMVRILGEERVRTLERAFDLVQTLITQGPIALWERIVQALGNFWELVIGGIRQWAIRRIVEAAITRLLSLFTPVGAIIQAILAIYNTIKFFVERIRQIAQTVEAIAESVARIAAGALAPAANAVERAMARTLPLVLDFLARLIGLGDVSGQIRRVIEGLQERVDRALDRAVDWVIERGRALLERGRAGVARIREWWQMRKGFRDPNGAPHTLYFEGEGARAELVVATTPQRMVPYFRAWEAEIPAVDTVANRGQRSALADSRQRFDDVRGKQREMNAAPSGSPARQTAYEQMDGLLGQLAAAIALRTIGGQTPLPPPILPASTDSVRAASFKARFINRSLVGTGTTNTQSKQPHSWDVVSRHRLSDRSAWVRMHLLTAELGGNAVESNLVPARGVTTNQEARDEVEHPARNALTAGSERMIWYQVQVNYHTSNATQYGIGFPSYIRITWNGYELDPSQNWREKPERANRKFEQSPQLPSLSGTTPKLLINFDGRPRLAEVLNVDRTFAQLILDLKDEQGKYDNWIQLRDRLNSWNDRQVARRVRLRADFAQQRDRALAVASDPTKVDFTKQPV